MVHKMTAQHISPAMVPEAAEQLPWSGWRNAIDGDDAIRKMRRAIGDWAFQGGERFVYAETNDGVKVAEARATLDGWQYRYRLKPESA